MILVHETERLVSSYLWYGTHSNCLTSGIINREPHSNICVSCGVIIVLKIHRTTVYDEKLLRNFLCEFTFAPTINTTYYLVSSDLVLKGKLSLNKTCQIKTLDVPEATKYGVFCLYLQQWRWSHWSLLLGKEDWVCQNCHLFKWQCLPACNGLSYPKPFAQFGCSTQCIRFLRLHKKNVEVKHDKYTKICFAKFVPFCKNLKN